MTSLYQSPNLHLNYSSVSLVQPSEALRDEFQATLELIWDLLIVETESTGQIASSIWQVLSDGLESRIACFDVLTNHIHLINRVDKMDLETQPERIYIYILFNTETK